MTASRRRRVHQRQAIYQGPVFRLVRDTVLAGGLPQICDVILHPGAAVVVPRLDRSRIILVRQYRHPVGRELLELPAGTLRKNERPMACAKRELAEETDWSASALRPIGRFYAAPGYTNERMVVFLASGLTRTTASPDPDEEIRSVILTVRSALAKIRSGEICDAKSIIGILLARRFLA